MAKKITLDDIFNDDEFGLLDITPTSSNIKSEEDRLIESFEEINLFIDKNGREPNKSSMSEYGLLARLRNFRENEENKKILKPFDRHNLLGYVEMEKPTIDDILNDDEFGLLDIDNKLDIFKFKHTPKPEDRAKTDFTAKRKPIKEKEFKKYEKIFQQVHRELKDGIRKIKEFKDVEQHLKVGHFYILNGVMCYLEEFKEGRDNVKLKKDVKRRKDGRTRTIFENATVSNMNYRSLGKSLYTNGKIVTEPHSLEQPNLFVDSNGVKENDIPTGWIYVLKSKSDNPKLKNIKDLYKIGFSTKPIEKRIKNAKNEATYLFDEVQIVATYEVFNRNAKALESLLHRFFAHSCLNVDLFNNKGQRITPREWFVVPFEVIEESISLTIKESIINYEYDVLEKRIVLKGKK